MIVALLLLLSCSEPALQLQPGVDPVRRVVPPLLQGIDQLPDRAALRRIDLQTLMGVALDDDANAVHRARAVRLLGAHVDAVSNQEVAQTLGALRASSLPELRVHAALAQGNLAARIQQVVPFAAGLLNSDDVELRFAGLTLLWICRSQAARAVVVAHAAREQDPGLLHLLRSRLRSWKS